MVLQARHRSSQRVTKSACSHVVPPGRVACSMVTAVSASPLTVTRGSAQFERNCSAS